MKKLLIFHPNIAPYRIDFFNSLNTYFDMHIYLNYPNLLSQKFNIEKINDKLFFTPNIIPKGFRILKREIRPAIKKIIIENKPDIIFTNEYSFNTIFIVLLRILANKKYKIVTICDDSVDVAKKCNVLRKISRNIILRKIDGTILCNHNAYQWYIYKYPKSHFFIFPIIQEETNFRNRLEKSISISNKYIQDYKLEGKKVILFVGRLAAVKNLPLLINVFKNIIKKEPLSRLIIVGSGEKEMELKQLTTQKGLNDFILFPGRYEDLELLAWYNIGSLFVLPSSFEPFGAVTNEALLAGMPALISKHAGSTYLINENNGNIFSLNEQKLYTLLIEWIYKIPTTRKITNIRNSLMPFSYKECMDKLCYQINNIAN